MAIGRVGVRPYSGGTSTTTTTSGLDTDAQAFITATTLTDTTQINAINDLVLDLKAAGVWTKMKALYPMVGGTATTHKFNLKDPRDLEAAYRLTFYGGWTHTSTGALPNGTDAYANTFLSTSAIGLNSGHLSFYSRTNNTNLGIDIGSYLGSPTSNSYLRLYVSGAIRSYGYCGASTANVSGVVSTLGFYSVSRTSSSVMKGYRNGSIEINSTVNSNGTSTRTIYLGANNNDGLPGGRSNRENAFASIGDGLTDLESNLFYQIVEKYQYALGRNVNANQTFYFNRNYSNETNAFIFNGAISDATQQSAINTLVNDLKAAGIWTKMKALYPMVGGTALAHKFNLVNPVDAASAYALTFAGGWTHSSTGALPNGTDAYANTFLTPSSSLTLNSSHISYYIRNNINANQVPIGTISDSSTRYSFFYPRLSNTISGMINASTNSISITNILDSLGLHTFSRTSSTSVTFSKNLTQYVRSQNSSSLPTRSFYIGASNTSNGTPAYYSTHECAFSSIGDGLTDLESNLFYQIVEKFQYTLGRNVNTAQPFYYNSSYTNETNAFIFNGAVTDATQISAVNTLVTTLKTAGIWTKMKAVYPMVGGTATSHKFNLVNPIDTDAAYRLTFAGGGGHDANGYQLNGSTSYANTSLTPSLHMTSSLNNMHMSVYSRTNIDEGRIEMGSWTLTTEAQYLNMYLRSSNTFYGTINVSNSNWVAGSSASNNNSSGFFIANRTASNVLNGFRNSSKILDKTTSSSVLQQFPIYLGAVNNRNISTLNFSSKQTCFYSIGDGLTDAEALTFYNAVQAFQTTLGRQV